MKNTIAQYTVTADRTTGEWLEEPEYVGDVLVSDWNAKMDTADMHFDTCERFTSAASVDSETCAIEITWED
ncbi:hypothetical protein [Ferrovum myxofaciens]|uniref:hypothetical protein n=1 Tax=Ferrovum myxofaciens TaxID=416213 RepID=UPI00235724CF|nr:hypothetical protein [Ferrovum myxofaciens]MBU6995915.1 hypothetical protein [Ferrovum myxofaciens]